jgi:hypothetical protein
MSRMFMAAVPDTEAMPGTGLNPADTRSDLQKDIPLVNEHINGTPLGHARDQHWSVEQAARRLRVSEEELSRLIAAGTVKTIKCGPLGTRVTEAEIVRVKSLLQGQQPRQRPAGLPGLEGRESALMLALWTAAGPLTVSELHGAGPATAPARTTLRSLDKLLAAGLVSRTRRERHPHAWLYRAALSPDQYAGRLARQVQEAVSQARATGETREATS